MPANLTPEFQKAQEWFRSASTDSEKILALEEMLRAIPKHKGTDHMQADIKRKLSKLRAAAESGKKRGGKHVDVFHVPRSGAGQVALIGLPNSGKSSIVGALSNAKVNIADYPFATSVPVPGMIHFEDVPIQLVDTPPVTADFAAPGQVGTYRGADLIGINNRNLETFEVDLQTTGNLMEHIKSPIPVVSESGISTPEDIALLKQAGCRAVLVGESIVKQGDIEAGVKALFAREWV